MYFVYILQSSSSGRFYIGSTDNLIRRFREHNSGHTLSTRHRGPWIMPYFEIFSTKSQALARERIIKSKKSSKFIERLIDSILQPS